MTPLKSVSLLLTASTLMSGMAWAGPIELTQARNAQSVEQDKPLGARGQAVFLGNASAYVQSILGDSSWGEQVTGYLAPGVDWFVLDGLSVGGSVLLGGYYFGDGLGASASSVTAGVALRLGYLFRLSERFSIWPRAELVYDHSWSRQSGSIDGRPVDFGWREDEGTLVSAMLPLVFEPAPHFLIGFGPLAFYDFSHPQPALPVQLALTFGGYL